MRAATLALPGSAASHATAAGLLALEHVPTTRVTTITAPPAAHHVLSGVRVRRSSHLPVEHIRRVRGIPVLTVERTLFDLAADIGDQRLRRVVEAALASRRSTAPALDEVFRELARKGRTGTSRMARVMQRIDGEPPPESELEARFLTLLELHGIEAPIRQMALPWVTPQAGRVDAAWPAHRLIAELDGRRYHTIASAYESDRRRDQLAAAAGWSTVRFMWRQVVHAPSEVIEALTALLGRGGRPRDRVGRAAMG